MNILMTVASRELLVCLRNRWAVAATVLLAGLALSLTFLGSAPIGRVGAASLDVVLVSLSSLAIFLVPLIALLIAHDAIVGEVERGTLPLLLSYPISRWQVIIGKFLGHVLMLTFAIVIGFGAAALAIASSGTELLHQSLISFGQMIGSSILLGAVFVAIGYAVSARSRDRATAAGVAIGVWLVLVVIYDASLLGALVADQGRIITAGILDTLLLLNPTDVYRLFNLTGSANMAQFAGMAGLANDVGWTSWTLLVALFIWMMAPLALSISLFARREL